VEPLADLTMTSQRHAALSALETIGEPAVDRLIPMLGSPSGHIRRNAAEALGWVGSPVATDALVDVLGDDRDAAVRAQAAWALGQIAAPAARAALERAELRDPVAAVRSQASVALARIPENAAAAAALPARWAPTLSRLEPLRWLLLSLSLAGAIWLAAGPQRLLAWPIVRRTDR
jgi:HEAT repeat protein